MLVVSRQRGIDGRKGYNPNGLALDDVVSYLKSLDNLYIPMKEFQFVISNVLYDPDGFDQGIEDSEPDNTAYEYEYLKANYDPTFGWLSVRARDGWDRWLCRRNSDRWRENHLKKCRYKLRRTDIRVQAEMVSEGGITYRTFNTRAVIDRVMAFIRDCNSVGVGVYLIA